MKWPIKRSLILIKALFDAVLLEFQSAAKSHLHEAVDVYEELIGGSLIRPLMNYFKIGIEDLPVVLHDDMDLASWKDSMSSSKGSAGGHNGIRILFLVAWVLAERVSPKAVLRLGLKMFVQKMIRIRGHVLQQF